MNRIDPCNAIRSARFRCCNIEIDLLGSSDQAAPMPKRAAVSYLISAAQ